MAKKVLIVEDDRNIADLLNLYLDKEGFETQVAPDGGKAVELFRACVPDLVLLDRGTLRAAATYAHSNQKAEGVCAVYVAGKCVYRAGALTGEYPGKLILRQGT